MLTYDFIEPGDVLRLLLRCTDHESEAFSDHIVKDIKRDHAGKMKEVILARPDVRLGTVGAGLPTIFCYVEETTLLRHDFDKQPWQIMCRDRTLGGHISPSEKKNGIRRF